uniref:Uncharacterized protein n=1 Tax=Zea mays TaxID=4577 RepID=A0A804NG27_MAIZE
MLRKKFSGRVRAGEGDGDPGGHGARGLPERRQLRHHLGHRQQRLLLRGQRHGHQALLAGHADAVVQDPPPRARAGGGGGTAERQRGRAAERRAGGAGRDRRERLQLRLLAGRAAGRGAQVRAGRGGQAGGRHGGAHRHGGARLRGAREPTLRLHAAVPAAVPRQRRVVGLRPGHGLPRLVQPLRPVPQPGARGAPRQAPAPAPGRDHRLRRLVRGHDEHLPGPREARVHKRSADLLREPDRAVWQARVLRLQGPVHVRVLGRDAPDGGGVQGDRRRGAARAARVPCSSRRHLSSDMTLRRFIIGSFKSGGNI